MRIHGSNNDVEGRMKSWRLVTTSDVHSYNEGLNVERSVLGDATLFVIGRRLTQEMRCTTWSIEQCTLDLSSHSARHRMTADANKEGYTTVERHVVGRGPCQSDKI